MSICTPVAQWIEQKVSNLLVAGSIPAGGTIQPENCSKKVSFSGILDRMDETPIIGTPPQPQPALPATPDPDIQENKDIAALGYVWALSIFVYLYKRQSPFVRHHARQGITLCLLSIACWFIPFAGRVLELPVLALMIMGFLNAAQGRYASLPLIDALSHGDMRMLRQSWKTVVDAIVRLWHKVRSHNPPTTPAL